MSKFVYIFSFAVIPLYGYTLHEIATGGYPLSMFDGKNVGLGYISIVVTDADNPACYDSISAVVINLQLHQITEERKVKVYNEFEDYVGEATRAIRDELHTVPMPLGINLYKHGVSFDFKVSPKYVFDYEFKLPMYDDYYLIRGWQIESSTGMVISYSAMLGVRVWPTLYVGVGGSYLKGDWQHAKMWRPSYEGSEPWDTSTSGKLQGINFTFGICIKPSFRWTIGGIWKISTLKDTLFDYPQFTYGVGIGYRPANILPAYFVAEVLTHQGKHREWEYHMGVEHELMPSFLLRAGFAWLSAAKDERLSKGIYTAGIGYRGAFCEIDIGISFWCRKYSAYLVDVEGFDKIDESMFSVIFTIKKELP